MGKVSRYVRIAGDHWAAIIASVHGRFCDGGDNGTTATMRIRIMQIADPKRVAICQAAADPHPHQPNSPQVTGNDVRGKSD